MQPRLTRPFACSLFAVWLAGSASGEEAALSTKAIRDRLAVAPIEEDKDRTTWNNNRRLQLEAFSPAERKVVERRDDGAWTRYEDSLISFELPDEKLLRVEKSQADIDTGVSIDRGSSYAQPGVHYVYRVTVNGRPYLSLAAIESEDLETGGGFWGLIPHERRFVADGNLLRFGMLRDGAIEKAEALGAKYYAVTQCWTQTPLRPEAYARIACSLRIKSRHPWTEAEWIARDKSLGVRLTWLNPGDDAERVRQVMGRPTREDDETWSYIQDDRKATGGGSRTTLKLPMREGKFQGVNEDGVTSDFLAPLPESVDWAAGLINSGPDGTTTEADAKLVFDAFLRNAEVGDPEIWGWWSFVMHDLTNQGFRDERVTKRLKETFLDPKRKQTLGIQFMELDHEPGRVGRYIQRLNLLMDSPDSYDRALFYEMQYLLESIGRESVESKTLLKKALEHPKGFVRLFGALYAPKFLAETEAREVILLRLSDAEASVRDCAALSLCDVAVLADLPRLRESRMRSTNPSTRANLKVRISELEARSSQNAK